MSVGTLIIFFESGPRVCLLSCQIFNWMWRNNRFANAGSSWTDKAGKEMRVLVPDGSKRGHWCSRIPMEFFGPTSSGHHTPVRVGSRWNGASRGSQCQWHCVHQSGRGQRNEVFQGNRRLEENGARRLVNSQVSVVGNEAPEVVGFLKKALKAELQSRHHFGKSRSLIQFIEKVKKRVREDPQRGRDVAGDRFKCWMLTQ